MSRRVIFFFFLTLIFLLIIRLVLHFSLSHKYSPQEVIDKEFTLFSDPKTSGRFQRFNLLLPSGQTLFVTIPSSIEISYGDTIRVRGEVKSRKIKEFETLPAGRQVLVLDYPQIAVKKADQNPLLAILAKVRYDIADFFGRNLPKTSSSLLMGIVFGIRDNMPPDFSDRLEATGLTHVVAASGMNITMIAGIFSISFGRIFKRRTALILTLFAIFLYAVLSGLSPSIVRAAIMGSIVFSSQILGRQNTSLIALFLTCFLMLFISPKLIFDIGFQLSAGATLGILLINPILKAKIRFAHPIVSENLFTTISAQVGTLPIILSNFGSYSLISIFVNFIVLWTVPSIMVLGAFSALLSFVFEPAAVLVAYLTYPFLYYFETAVEIFGQIAVKFTLQNLPWQIQVGYYLLIFSVILKLKK